MLNQYKNCFIIKYSKMHIPGESSILLFIYGCFIFNIGLISTKEYVADNISARRNAKAFSLFSVVTFKNEECTSEASFAGGAVKGTCYSSTECSDKAGTASGNCASGFGVCCVFISNIGTATLSENRTYLQSLLFPAIETSTTGITYTINKMSSDICQLRLDFDNFAISGPSVTDETLGLAVGFTNCADTLITTLTSNALVPTLCGTMTGSHLYLDMGMASTDTASLVLAFQATLPTAANAMRSWRIKTSQIQCFAPYRAPDGCHQYFFGSAFGQVWSPNFRTGPSTLQDPLHAAGTAAAQNEFPNYAVDLMGQDLKICIRREKGMCCTMFQVCNFDPDGVELVEALNGGMDDEGTKGMVSPGFSFLTDCSALAEGGDADENTQDVGLVDEDCSNDYVEIPDSSTGVKNYGSATVVNSRYCCNRFGQVVGLTAEGVLSHAPVYDCTEPFEINYHTDIWTDEGNAATQANDLNSIVQRGLCLLYKQEAC